MGITVSDKEIRAAIKAVIKSEQPEAVVYPWNALSHDLKEWAGLFRTASGGTHGWIIKRAALNGAWKNGRRDKKAVPYDVWGFYLFRSGEGVTEADNSDNEFAAICDSIYEAFKENPRLGFDNTVEGHDLLQYAALTTINCGEETLHFAQGRLVVHLCC